MFTDSEQAAFEEKFIEVSDIKSDTQFIKKLGDLIFEMTGNVNLKMRLFVLSKKLKGC